MGVRIVEAAAAAVVDSDLADAAAKNLLPTNLVRNIVTTDPDLPKIIINNNQKEKSILDNKMVSKLCTQEATSRTRKNKKSSPEI